MKQLIVLFAAGLLFGIGLAVSGMTDPAKVVGFLDLFGDWNPALAFVMGGALTTFATGMIITRHVRGGKGFFGTAMPDGGSDPISKKLVLGSVLFGIGWGISGFCPGPALANLAAWRIDAVVFCVTMLIGMATARLIVGVDKAN